MIWMTVVRAVKKKLSTKRKSQKNRKKLKVRKIYNYFLGTKFYLIGYFERNIRKLIGIDKPFFTYM